MKEVRIGVIGLGMGAHHVKRFARSPYARVTALCDANEELLGRRAKEFGVGRTFTDYEEMLEESELDAVSVALPNYLHARASIKALKRGLHVFCEKPLARTADEVKEVMRAARDSGRILMVNFPFRSWPGARFLKGMIDEGEIGDMYFGRTWWLRSRGVPKVGSWYGQKELSGGGPLIDIGVHRLDLALWLMGFPEPVAVSGVTYDLIAKQIANSARVKLDVEDLAAGLVRFGNGASLVVVTSWAGNSEKREEMATELFGTKGGVIHRNVGESYEFEVKVLREAAGSYTETSMRFPLSRKEDSTAEHFVRCIAAGEKPEVTAEESLKVAKIIDALYASAKVGKEVEIAREG